MVMFAIAPESILEFQRSILFILAVDKWRRVDGNSDDNIYMLYWYVDNKMAMEGDVT
jgi:hypothetical protein